MLGPSAQHLVPRELHQDVKRGVVRLASIDRVQDPGGPVLQKPGSLEVLEEGSAEDGLEVKDEAFRVLGERVDLHVERLEEEGEPLVDFPADGAQLRGEGSAQGPDRGAGLRDRDEELLDDPFVEPNRDVALFRLVAALVEAGLEVVAVDLELVELLLELRHGGFEAGGFDDGVFFLLGGLDELVGELRDG